MVGPTSPDYPWRVDPRLCVLWPASGHSPQGSVRLELRECGDGPGAGAADGDGRPSARCQARRGDGQVRREAEREADAVPRQEGRLEEAPPSGAATPGCRLGRSPEERRTEEPRRPGSPRAPKARARAPDDRGRPGCRRTRSKAPGRRWTRFRRLPASHGDAHGHARARRAPVPRDARTRAPTPNRGRKRPRGCPAQVR